MRVPEPRVDKIANPHVRRPWDIARRNTNSENLLQDFTVGNYSLDSGLARENADLIGSR